MVIQWSHCNGSTPSLGYISPSKTTFATAPTAIAMVNQRAIGSHCNGDSQGLYALSQQSLFHGKLMAPIGNHCNGNQRHRWKPLQWRF